MTEIKEHINYKRLCYAVELLKLEFPVAELSRKTGYSEPTISTYLSGKVKPSTKFLQSIEESFKVDLESYVDNTPVLKAEEPTNNYKVGVPYYDVDFMAGFLPVENSAKSVPDSYITHPFFKGCDYVVRASGQSMAKLISHGDAIGLTKVNNWQEFFPFGEVYAIVTKDGFRMIKVITKGETEETFTLISKPTDGKKEEFPPQQIKKSLILSIFKVQASSHLF